MTTLYLSDSEHVKFSSLPETLRASVSVEKEVRTYDDSPRRRRIRLESFASNDPELARFKSAAENAQSEGDLLNVLQSLNLKKIGDAAYAHLLFAMGPSVVSLIIEELLSDSPDAASLELVSAYSLLRHDMLASLQLYSPQTS